MNMINLIFGFLLNKGRKKQSWDCWNHSQLGN